MYPEYPLYDPFEIPQMASGGQHGGLDRWFAEKWVDVKTGKECGRQEGEKRKGYPACRPSKRVNADTPKTASELSSAERERFKREKTSSKRIDYQHRRREFGGEEIFDTMEEFKSGGNVPTNPALWSKAKAAARAKYDVYPSAYANGFAAKWYKQRGGGWKKAEYGMEVMGEGGVPNNPGFNALPQFVQDQIIANMASGGAVDLNAFYNQPRYIQTNIYKDGGEPDGSMALTQINAMMDRLSNLQKFIQQDSDLDPWISDKISVMNHSATAINDYMMYGDEGSEEETMEMKNGGGIPERYKNMGFSRVGQKKESNRDGKKWMVLAKKGDDYKVVHGGYDGMKDYTQHGSEKRRDRFWDRMGGRDSAKAKDPFSPLYWHKRFGTWQDGGELPMAAYGIDPPGLVPPLPTGTPLYYGEVNSGSPYPIVPIPVSGTPFEAPVVKPSRPKPLFKVDDNLRSGAPVTPPLPISGTPIDLPMNKLSMYSWTADPRDIIQDKSTTPSAPAAAANTATKEGAKNTNGLWNQRTYDALSMLALLPLGNRGLAGLTKGLIGTAGFVGGVGTGMDNIYRGFQPRQEKGGEIPRYEMAGTAMGKPVTNYDPLGLMDPEEQKRKWGLDPTGVARMLGAATGLGMMNDVIGYNQNMRNFERNQVRTGMSDMMGVSNPFMPQGYDVLNTGPGQTQAPNMYTPVQFAGNRMPGFFEEGGEYEMTEDELQQFLAMGGQVEYI